MILLPNTKRWTGDGYGDSDARIFTQITRNETVALYRRNVEASGRLDGYEVFVIKKRLKGQPLPGGLFEKEDREVYPSAGSFGRSAWHIQNLAYAQFRFAELTSKNVTDEEGDEENVPVVKSFIIPVGAFTTKELAVANQVEYSIAFLWLKDNVDKTVRVIGERKPAGQRGRASKTYEKIP